MQNIKPLSFTGLFTVILITCFGQPVNRKQAKVNQQRMESRIFELAKFGKDSTGRGYRVAYTKGDIEATNLVYRLNEKSRIGRAY